MSRIRASDKSLDQQTAGVTGLTNQMRAVISTRAKPNVFRRYPLSLDIAYGDFCRNLPLTCLY